MAQELQVVKYDLAYSSEVLQSLQEELGTDAALPYDIITFPTAGGTAFEMPTEDGETEPVKSIEGVIIFAHDIKVFYEKPLDGKGTPPDCSSMDGKKGVETATGVCKDCSTCPYNVFGSGKNGGKACKAKKRIYLLPSGALLPVIITVPVMSCKDYNTYIAKQIVLRHLRSYEVVTKVALKSEVSNSGFKYSKGVFLKMGKLAPELIPQAKQLHDEMAKTYMDYAITSADAVSGEAAAAPTETPEKSDTETPEKGDTAADIADKLWQDNTIKKDQEFYKKLGVGMDFSEDVLPE